MSIKLNFFIVAFRISVALLVFYIEGLFIGVSGVLKSPTMIIFPSISPFMAVNVCHVNLGAPVFGAYMLMIGISSSWMDHLIMK